MAPSFDGSGNLTERYITDPRTVNAFFGQVSAAGQTEFYLTDQEHSVLMVLDASGNVLDQIAYDAYGNIVSQTNAANASAYLFQGGSLDANLGLYHFGARWYDPNGGRWISQDPMSFAAGDSNLYRFVSNSPTNFTDPSGNQEAPRGLRGEYTWGEMFGDLWEGSNDGAAVFLNNLTGGYAYRDRANRYRSQGGNAGWWTNYFGGMGADAIQMAAFMRVCPNLPPAPTPNPRALAAAANAARLARLNQQLARARSSLNWNLQQAEHAPAGTELARYFSTRIAALRAEIEGIETVIGTIR